MKQEVYNGIALALFFMTLTTSVMAEPGQIDNDYVSDVSVESTIDSEVKNYGSVVFGFVVIQEGIIKYYDDWDAGGYDGGLGGVSYFIPNLMFLSNTYPIWWALKWDYSIQNFKLNLDEQVLGDRSNGTGQGPDGYIDLGTSGSAHGMLIVPRLFLQLGSRDRAYIKIGFGVGLGIGKANADIFLTEGRSEYTEKVRLSRSYTDFTQASAFLIEGRYKGFFFAVETGAVMWDDKSNGAKQRYQIEQRHLKLGYIYDISF